MYFRPNGELGGVPGMLGKDIGPACAGATGTAPQPPPSAICLTLGHEKRILLSLSNCLSPWLREEISRKDCRRGISEVSRQHLKDEGNGVFTFTIQMATSTFSSLPCLPSKVTSLSFLFFPLSLCHFLPLIHHSLNILGNYSVLCFMLGPAEGG